jgi:phosphoglycolate phosphatase-like HAD superfamily hydrolase
MRKFLLWDQDGVLVDTERWFFVATQECLRELSVELDQARYLQYMAAGARAGNWRWTMASRTWSLLKNPGNVIGGTSLILPPKTLQ